MKKIRRRYYGGSLDKENYKKNDAHKPLEDMKGSRS